ncbi:MAG: pyridoxal-phosphate dependent enzyme [Holophaga sp.]|nr:pyridoxal-phosphate dependent enzyme [Holophaga sp.]
MEEAPDPGWARSELCGILETLTDRFALAGGMGDHRDAARPGLERVRRYLGLNFRDRVCLQDLADLAGVGRFHLVRSFKRATGFTPYEYLVDQMPGSKVGEVSGEDLARVEEVAQELVRERGAFRADQFQLDGNFRAHYLQTGPEILEQAGCAIDGFCDFAGTGGSFAGCAAALKERDPRTRCYVVEPEGAAPLAGQPVTRPNHPIQGGGYAIPHLKFVRPELLDGYLQVSGTAARAMARNLARIEGVFAGFSSGANVAAAVALLEGDLKGGTLAVLLNDSGLKYLSTDLWE